MEVSSLRHDTLDIKSLMTEIYQAFKVKLVPASRVVREDPEEPVRVPYMINRKMHYLTNDEINKHLEKEELIKKVAEQTRLLAITKPEVVKVHKYENYMWTIDNRLKPEKITDVKIHPHTKPVVVTVYRITDKRTFEVHNPFMFGAFGISELDELREIIPKNKNVVVKDLMNSLSRRKRKHVELKPEIKVPGLDCDRSLPKGVPFAKNMVNEEPEYGIFFTDVFGDQAFQIWSDGLNDQDPIECKIRPEVKEVDR
ncbi:hypothetical protein Tco_0889354 [Tanacetum coccineum]